jgi:citrate lyase subunit gamma (acyl carrier protein)
MEIVKAAIAGSLESCDALVAVEKPLAPGLVLTVEGADHRFEARVREAALAALAELGVLSAKVRIQERSALDCTVRARVRAACLRAAGLENAPWEALK